MSRRRIKGKPYNCPYGCKTWKECDDRNSTPSEQLHGVLQAARNNIFYCNCICWEWLEHVMLTDLCKFKPKKQKKMTNNQHKLTLLLGDLIKVHQSFTSTLGNTEDTDNLKSCIEWLHKFIHTDLMNEGNECAVKLTSGKV